MGGEDISIADLAKLIGKVVGYQGEIRFDTSKPDGTPRKLMDVSRLTATGCQARVGLEKGLMEVYEWFCEHIEQFKS